MTDNQANKPVQKNSKPVLKETATQTDLIDVCSGWHTIVASDKPFTTADESLKDYEIYLGHSKRSVGSQMIPYLVTELLYVKRGRSKALMEEEEAARKKRAQPRDPMGRFASPARNFFFLLFLLNH